MKTKSFKHYAINGLIFFLLASSGWLYIDYKDYAKWSRWQQMTESAEYHPIKVKLLNIVEIEETSAVASYNSNINRVQSTKHSQGWLIKRVSGIKCGLAG